MVWSRWGWWRPGLGVPSPPQMLPSLPPAELTPLLRLAKGEDPRPAHTGSPPTAPAASEGQTPSALPPPVTPVGQGSALLRGLRDHGGSFGSVRRVSGVSPQPTRTPAFMEGAETSTWFIYVFIYLGRKCTLFLLPRAPPRPPLVPPPVPPAPTANFLTLPPTPRAKPTPCRPRPFTGGRGRRCLSWCRKKPEGQKEKAVMVPWPRVAPRPAGLAVTPAVTSRRRCAGFQPPTPFLSYFLKVSLFWQNAMPWGTRREAGGEDGSSADARGEPCSPVPQEGSPPPG